MNFEVCDTEEDQLIRVRELRKQGVRTIIAEYKGGVYIIKWAE